MELFYIFLFLLVAYYSYQVYSAYRSGRLTLSSLFLPSEPSMEQLPSLRHRMGDVKREPETEPEPELTEREKRDRYIRRREDEAEARNKKIEDVRKEYRDILNSTLSVYHDLDFDSLYDYEKLPVPSLPRELATPESAPSEETYRQPRHKRVISRCYPGHKGRKAASLIKQADQYRGSVCLGAKRKR